MRKQTVNVLDNWIHMPLQAKEAEDEHEKNPKPVINNEIISYSYINYIY